MPKGEVEQNKAPDSESRNAVIAGHGMLFYSGSIHKSMSLPDEFSACIIQAKSYDWNVYFLGLQL